jgi:hypothetical protein
LLIDIDVTSFRNAVNVLKIMWTQLKQYETEIHTKVISWEELSRVNDVIREIKEEVREVVTGTSNE